MKPSPNFITVTALFANGNSSRIRINLDRIEMYMPKPNDAQDQNQVNSIIRIIGGPGEIGIIETVEDIDKVIESFEPSRTFGPKTQGASCA